MKQLLYLLAMAVSFSLNAQTTATNFTATDCDGAAHTLFSNLDDGKIVVLVWVMPCPMCISDAKGAYEAAQSFAASHPGRVKYYLADDVGDDGCSALAAWTSGNGIGSDATLFANSGTPIDENNYGGTGMPHVVVMGGADHKIYFNKRNGSNNKTAIQNAISAALSTTGVANLSPAISALQVAPNPARKQIIVRYTLGESSSVTIGVYDLRGLPVKLVSAFRGPGSREELLSLDESLAAGYYLLRLSAGTSSLNTGFVVIE